MIIILPGLILVITFRYLDHMCELNKLDKKHAVLQPVVLKVLRQ